MKIKIKEGEYLKKARSLKLKDMAFISPGGRMIYKAQIKHYESAIKIYELAIIKLLKKIKEKS